VRRSQTVVNSVQIKELHDVISLLADDIFIDRQQKYYVVIDRLDEEWVGEGIKHKLIRALIETVRNFRKVQNVKIILAMRTDLLQRILRESRSSGFQEEKYEPLYLRLKWNRYQLQELLDLRVNFLFEKQYTRAKVYAKDILPQNQIDKGSALDYIIGRTFLRPREAILFMNECLERTDGSSRIKITDLRSAEPTYSRKRLRSLEDEWRADYPILDKYIIILKERRCPFKLDEIDDRESEQLGTAILEEDESRRDPGYLLAEKWCLVGDISKGVFLRKILSILYQVGIVGVKMEAHLPMQWSYMDEPLLGDERLVETASMDVHPTFWTALGIRRSGSTVTRDAAA
jgi:hypothetical protein